jgi:hypothetical protein
MVDAATELLLRRGAPEARIHFDKFTTTADAYPPEAPRSTLGRRMSPAGGVRGHDAAATAAEKIG